MISWEKYHRTRWWLHDWLFIRFCLFQKENYRLIDSRAIQQIIFTGKVDEAAVLYYIYEKSKETTLHFSKGTTKVL